MNKALNFLPLIVVVQLPVLILFKVHRIIARFVSLSDLTRIIQSAFTGVSVTAVILFIVNRLEHIPRSVFVIDFILLIFFLGGVRFLWRIFKERPANTEDSKKVIIIGAGQGGEQLARDILNRDKLEYCPVGFLDDDRKKQGMIILGLPVLGRPRDLHIIAEQYDVELAFLAIPSADKTVISSLVNICKNAGISYRTLPSIHSILSGSITVSSLREVTIDDLLGRDPVKLDWENIKAEIEDQTVLVSGAGGSIGSELCRQIRGVSPAKLVLLESNEFALSQIEFRLKKERPEVAIVPLLGDIRDLSCLETIFKKFRPDIVFHAAAYKHVPVVEMNPVEGVKTNVLGVKNIADMASCFKTRKFITISTDKAVNPSNVMGATKRIAELYCKHLNQHSGTAFITTRFGNVLGSSGSVVPIFSRQIAEGGPVTVTHPEVKRYFMTISEACQLVLQAAAIGKGGELFVLDMGQPLKIKFLAEQMITLSGLSPYKDIDIKYIGLRPGEKLNEKLFYPEEDVTPTAHSKILLTHNHSKVQTDMDNTLKDLNKACKLNNIEEIMRILKYLAPEYEPQTK